MLFRSGIPLANNPNKDNSGSAGSNPTSENDPSLLETVWESFKENFWSDLRNAILEGSGNSMVRVAGLINILTSTARSAGENAFVILNPAVIGTTSKIANIGGAIAKGAKYGLPVIGAVIDFASMKGAGESTVDAGVKTVAHVGIGIAGGKAGAAIGAAVGSVIPGAGTAAGAVIGFVAGVAITTVGNLAFDFVYDNKEAIEIGRAHV